MKVPVMYYLNQFFVGIGGEDKADVPVGSLKGVVGPGKPLQDLIKDSAEIVVTAYCGDNYFNDYRDEVLPSILKIAQEHDVKIVVAGPAFNAGRYGFACIEVCHFMSTSADLYCVTGMSTDNPGLEGYKQYKDRKIFAFPTTGDVTGMEDALAKMARAVLKLAAGSAMGPASEEGYIPRGLRVVEVVSKSGVNRAVDMLLDKLAGRPFATEIPIEIVKETPIAQRIVNLKDAHIALASTAGVHPKGNPRGFKPSKNTQWAKYPIGKLNSMTDAEWVIIHCGIHAESMEANPNYGNPLDVCREMEREGVFAKLNPNFYSTTGVVATITAMEGVGKGIATDMKAEGVDAVIMVSTWGTDSRSGAVIAKEIERGGIPTAYITPMVSLAEQMKAKRIIKGVSVPHPCGDPQVPEESDQAMRQEIVKCALKAIQTDVDGPTIFTPNVTFR